MIHRNPQPDVCPCCGAALTCDISSSHLSEVTIENRLTIPAVADGTGEMQTVSWETAMDVIADRIRMAQQHDGNDAVGFHFSGEAMLEEYYLWQKLVRGFLRTNNITFTSPVELPPFGESALRAILGSGEGRKRLEERWDCKPLRTHPGNSEKDWAQDLESGNLKVFWIVGRMPGEKSWDRERMGEALQNADLVIYQGASADAEEVELADVLLPAATRLEKDGTVLSHENGSSAIRRWMSPPGDALPAVEIVQRFARAMGWFPHFDFDQPSDIQAELTAL